MALCGLGRAFISLFINNVNQIRQVLHCCFDLLNCMNVHVQSCLPRQRKAQVSAIKSKKHSRVCSTVISLFYNRSVPYALRIVLCTKEAAVLWTKASHSRCCSTRGAEYEDCIYFCSILSGCSKICLCETLQQTSCTVKCFYILYI